MSRKGIRPMVFVVIRCDDDVLVWVGHDEFGGTYHRLIGGGIELGESAAAAVAREVREELGADLTGVRFAGVVEDIFPNRGQLHHELGIVFQAGFADPSWYDRQISRMLDHEEIEVTWRPTAPGAAPEPLYPPGIATLLDETAVMPVYVPAERE